MIDESQPLDDPGELSRQVYESEAFQIYARFVTLTTNYFVFDRNQQEMMKLLAAMQQPSNVRRLWDHDNRRELHVVLRELTRLLLNLVASATSLVAHTRRLIDSWYGDTEFKGEYEQQVEERFTGNPTVGFVEDLRNYAVHYRLPTMTAVLEFTTDPQTQEAVPVHRIVLDKTSLLEWSGWKRRKGKPYLETADDPIALRKVIEEYSQDVRSFHQWMHKRLRELHAAELAWLEEMRQRISESLK